MYKTKQVYLNTKTNKSNVFKSLKIKSIYFSSLFANYLFYYTNYFIQSIKYNINDMIFRNKIVL